MLAAMVTTDDNILQSITADYKPALIISTSGGIITQVNQEACELFGYTAHAFCQINFSAIMYEMPEIGLTDLLAAANKNKEAINVRCRTANHRVFDAAFMFSAMTGPGQEETICCSISSLAEKKHALRQNDEDNLVKETLINSTSDLMWSVSTAFTLVAANRAFTDSMQLLTSKQFKPGDDLIDVSAFTEEHLTFWKTQYLRAFAGEHFKQEIFYPSSDDSADRWDEISFNPVYNGNTITGVACFSRNITEQKKAELYIRNSEEKRRLIMNAALDAIICINLTGHITFWNPQAHAIFGWSENEVLGQLLSSLIIPERFRKYHDAGMEHYLKTGKGAGLNVLLELEGQNRNGDIFPIELTVLPIKQAKEEFFCAFIRDITQRKKAEEAIVLSNERYNIIARTTTDSIWDWDLVTNEVIRPGKKLENLLGYEVVAPAAVDLFWQTHVHAEDWDRMVRERTRLLDNPAELYWQDEYRFLKPDQKYAYIEDKGYILRNKEGRAIRMIGASRDITGEKERVNEIIRIQHNLDSLINTTSDMIWSVDTGYRIITANKAYSNSLEVITGQPVREGDGVFRPDFGAPRMEKWAGFYAKALTGIQFSVEESFFNPVKMDWWYSIISFSPIVNDENQVTGVACFAKDVTELKRSADKLEELNKQLIKKADELVVSNMELEQFAYVASHDLQEPLRMITGFLTQLEKKYAPLIDDKGKKYIDFAVDGARRMRQIILDLLEFSRAGRAEDKKEELDLNELIDEICMLLRSKIEKSGAIIRVAELPAIHASRSSLRQVFQNLISNALKYHNPLQTPEVAVDVKDVPGYLEFTVRDNGIGISHEYFDKIFILFQRLHSKDEYPGTGMGLALTKKIVENGGGKIWVDSEPGKGSTFHFTVTK